MYRSEIEKLIHENFGGIIQDYPWEDSPEYTVFRHADNRKWFALITKVKFSVLHIDKEGAVDIINLKCDPDMIEELVRLPGILPAYHMNKQHWITVLLNGSVKPEKLVSLIDISYQLTAKKRRLEE